jgi:hypothetical protein
MNGLEAESLFLESCSACPPGLGGTAACAACTVPTSWGASGGASTFGFGRERFREPINDLWYGVIRQLLLDVVCCSAY